MAKRKIIKARGLKKYIPKLGNVNRKVKGPPKVKKQRDRKPPKRLRFKGKFKSRGL